MPEKARNKLYAYTILGSAIFAKTESYVHELIKQAMLVTGRNCQESSFWLKAIQALLGAALLEVLHN